MSGRLTEERLERVQGFPDRVLLAGELELLRAIRDAARDLLDNHETNARHLRLAAALDAYDKRVG